MSKHETQEPAQGSREEKSTPMEIGFEMAYDGLKRIAQDGLTANGAMQLAQQTVGKINEALKSDKYLARKFHLLENSTTV